MILMENGSATFSLLNKVCNSIWYKIYFNEKEPSQMLLMMDLYDNGVQEQEVITN